MHHLFLAGFTSPMPPAILPVWWVLEGRIKTVFVAEGVQPVELVTAASTILTIDERNYLRQQLGLPLIRPGMSVAEQAAGVAPFCLARVPAALQHSMAG